MTDRKRSGKLLLEFFFACLFTVLFLFQSTSHVQGQALPLPKEIVEPESKWPDSLAFIVYDREAQVLNLDDIRRRIVYPQVLKDAEIPPNKVLVRILLDEYGNYVRHYVIKAADPEFMKELEPLIPEIMWLPAEQDGRPVSSWVTIPFRFHLLYNTAED